MTKITPIFLLSLPRSGSTLVQRVIGSHKDIATHAEPWILLPHLSTLRGFGSCADYDFETSQIAIHEFVGHLQGKRDRYLELLNRFACEMYRSASESEKFFLDKTPRYSLLVDQLHEVFPDAKYIYLWRNPLAVIASSVQTWGRSGEWNIHRIHVDLFVGLPNLVSSYEENQPKAYSCRYEDLVADKGLWKDIFNYIDVDWEDDVIDRFTEVEVNGAMGDKTGRASYQKLSASGVDGWKSVIRSPLRKMWCRRYLKWLGEDRLQLMGYDLKQLLDELNEVPVSFTSLPMDMLAMFYGFFYGMLELPMLNKQIRGFRRGRKAISHR